MNQKHHVRSSSHGRKIVPAATRPTKPPSLHKRGHSYNHAPSHNHGGSSSGKTHHGGSKKFGTEVASQSDHADGMASFLQFCPNCEKQIVTPDSGVLYCSEACRKKDANRQTPVQTMHSPSTAPSSVSYFESTTADIVPQRSPTVPRPASLAFSDLTISDSGSPPPGYQERFGRQDSEAARYLAQFYSERNPVDLVSSRRSRVNRASAGNESGLPSLSNTPSSSVGTAASVASYRPLPPRHGPLTGHFPTGSDEIVMPSYPNEETSKAAQLVKDASLKSSASTLTSFHEAEASFDRHTPSWSNSDQKHSSLRQLFRHEAMKRTVNEC